MAVTGDRGSLGILRGSIPPIPLRATPQWWGARGDHTPKGVIPAIPPFGAPDFSQISAAFSGRIAAGKDARGISPRSPTRPAPTPAPQPSPDDGDLT